MILATCMDLMPTLLELAQAEHPNSSSGVAKAPYRDRQVYPMRGKSWTKWLTAGERTGMSKREESEAIHGEDDAAVGWEMFGRASLRKGRYKIVNMPFNFFGTFQESFQGSYS